MSRLGLRWGHDERSAKPISVAASVAVVPFADGLGRDTLRLATAATDQPPPSRWTISIRLRRAVRALSWTSIRGLRAGVACLATTASQPSLGGTTSVAATARTRRRNASGVVLHGVQLLGWRGSCRDARSRQNHRRCLYRRSAWPAGGCRDSWHFRHALTCQRHRAGGRACLAWVKLAGSGANRGDTGADHGATGSRARTVDVVDATRADRPRLSQKEAPDSAFAWPCPRTPSRPQPYAP